MSALADNATLAARKMLLEGLTGRQSRFAQIRKYEDAYNGVPGVALKGRNNVPFDGVVLGGYVDTIVAEVTADNSFTFSAKREQDKKSADMLTAAAEIETSADRGDWDGAIQDARFLACLSGRGFLKPVFSNIPRFKADLQVPDHYDMVVENAGPRHLDEHMYKHQMNIFRSGADLKAAAADGFYDKGQVQILLSRQNDETYQKRMQDEFGNKAARLTGFGITFQNSEYVGTSLFNLTESVIQYEGKWYYLLWDPKLCTWVRFQPLEEVIELAKDFPGRSPWYTFAYHRHPHLFWSKAPADDIYPVAYSMKKILNLTLDEQEKNVWDMRAYDPKIFRNPSQLLYRQNGLVRATLKQGQNIQDGIYSFQTKDHSAITVNLVQWMDNFLGQKTGITADAQGSSKEERVGILVSNLTQVTKRLGLSNRTFKEALTGIGTALDYGFYEYLREDYAVKLLGPKGAQWEEKITRRDTEKEFSITVSDGSDEARANEVETARMQAGLDRMTADPNLQKEVNPRWRARQELKVMGLDDEQMRVALDTKNEADEEVLARAAQAIADCLEGKELYEMYRKASTGFVQKIFDFCDDNYPLLPPEALAEMSPRERAKYQEEMKEYDKLMAYATAHLPIVQENMARAAASVLAAGGQLELAPEGGAPSTAPALPGEPSMAGYSVPNAPLQPGAVEEAPMPV